MNFDEYSVGENIEVLNFLTNTWRKADVEEVDYGENEMLVNFEDGTQEWISIDADKIRRLTCSDVLSYEAADSPNDLSDRLVIDDSNNQDTHSTEENTFVKQDDPELNELKEESNELKRTIQEIANLKQFNKTLDITDVGSTDGDDHASNKRLKSAKNIQRQGEQLPSRRDNKSSSEIGKIKIQVVKSRKSKKDLHPKCDNKVKILKLKKPKPVHKLPLHKENKTDNDTVDRSVSNIFAAETPDSLSEKSPVKWHVTSPIPSSTEIYNAELPTKSNETKNKKHVSDKDPGIRKKSISPVKIYSSPSNEKPEKLPSLKIKLTRSSCINGSATSRDTFIVTKASTAVEDPSNDFTSENYAVENNDDDDEEEKNEEDNEGNDNDDDDDYNDNGSEDDDEVISDTEVAATNSTSRKRKNDDTEYEPVSSSTASKSEPRIKRKCFGPKYTKITNKNYLNKQSRFNFSIRRPLIHRSHQGENLTKLAIRQNIRKKIESKLSVSNTKSAHKPSLTSAVSVTSQPEKKRIKTLLPRVRLTSEQSTTSADAAPDFSITSPNNSSISPVTDTPNAVPSSTSSLICPVKDCQKQFRRENLLMMHIKHYHTEYQTLLKRTPNVADLAYARTVGKTISTPQSEFLKTISRMEEDRSKELERRLSVQSSTLTSEDENVSITDPKSHVKDDNLDSKNSQIPNDTSSSENAGKVKKSGGKVISDIKNSSLTVRAKSLSISSSSSPSSSPSPLSPCSTFSPNSSVNNVPSPQKTSETPKEESSLAQSNSILCSLLKMDPIIRKPPYDKMSDKKPSVNNSNTNKTPADKNKKSCRDAINCICGYADEDGLMMQCEICQCWQHGNCSNIEGEEDVPSDYVCQICRNPRRQRSSQRYLYTQHWFSKGRLPCLKQCNSDIKLLSDREDYLKRTHNLLDRLLTMKDILHSLKIKNHILGQTTDHPKLYLWSKSWNEEKLKEEKLNMDSKKDISNGPVPEAAIDMTVCRKNLMDHIDEEIARFENCISELEYEVDDMDCDYSTSCESSKEEFDSDSPENSDSYTNELLRLVMNDLSCI